MSGVAAFSHTTLASESDVLQLPRRRLTGSQRFFSFRAVAGWNTLPQAARNAQSLGAFKRATSNDDLCLSYAFIHETSITYHM